MNRDNRLQPLLNKARANEDEMISSIAEVLALLLKQTELPAEKIGALRGILETLKNDTQNHQQLLNKMIGERGQ